MGAYSRPLRPTNNLTKVLMMLKRILTGAGIVAGTIAILLLAGTPVFPLAWSFFGSVGMTEYLRALSLFGKWMYTVPSLLVTAGLPFACYYIPDGNNLFFLVSAIVCYLLWMAAASVIWHDKTTVAETAQVSFGTLYIALCFAAFPMLYKAENNVLLIVLIFIGAWVTDTFALFVGKAFGKRKLAPDLSPNKTVAGSIGGILGCVAGCMVYALCVDHFTAWEPRYLWLALCAVPIAAISQIGDLFMSKVKREHGIKDFGKIFPGHGGVLDRFDSVLAIAPLVLLISFAFGSFRLFV